MTNETGSPELPSGRLDCRKAEFWIVLTLRERESEEWVTLEMTIDDWFSLPPLRRVIEEELKRRGIPIRSRWSLMGDTIACEGVPSGTVERRGEEEWVVITGYSPVREQPVTCEISFADWQSFRPVQWSIDDELERRGHESYYNSRDE